MDSTNERAFEALSRGEASHRDVFIAGSQSSGRGTRGRPWRSAPGGLYVSAVLVTETPPPPGAWTIAGGLAAHDLATRAGVTARLDWPNDLVDTEGAKVAGVLAESRGLRVGGSATFVLGIGVNVEATAVDGELRSERAVTSLEEMGSGIDVEAAEELALEALSARLEEANKDVNALYAAFFARCLQAGQIVEVSAPGSTVVGRWTGISPDLGLRIDALDPSAGRVRHVPIAHVRDVKIVTGQN